MQYLWLALLLLSAFLEIVFTKGFFLSFVPSSLVAMVLAFFDITPWVQLVVFFSVLLCAFLPVRLYARKAKLTENTPFTVESAIGTRCVVVERLDNLAGRGAVIVGGMEWAARTTSDDIVIEAGEAVEIIAVEGVKFICRVP